MVTSANKCLIIIINQTNILLVVISSCHLSQRFYTGCDTNHILKFFAQLVFSSYMYLYASLLLLRNLFRELWTIHCVLGSASKNVFVTVMICNYISLLCLKMGSETITVDQNKRKKKHPKNNKWRRWFLLSRRCVFVCVFCVSLRVWWTYYFKYVVRFILNGYYYNNMLCVFAKNRKNIGNFCKFNFILYFQQKKNTFSRYWSLLIN